MSTRPAARVRHNFSKLEKVLEVPNLIDIQRSSFEWFINEGLRETIDDISPIEDFTGTLAVQFGKYTLGGWEPGMPFDHIQPNDSIKDCREKDITYAAPLTMEVAFINRETGEIREQKVFMGDLPLMTEWGTYIINGTERVVVTQLVRSPGAYVMEPKDREKQVFIANLMPSRGSWVELEIDKKGLVHVRIDRKRKLPVTTLLFALGYTRDDVANLFRAPGRPGPGEPLHPGDARQGRHRGQPADRRPHESRRRSTRSREEIHALAKGLDEGRRRGARRASRRRSRSSRRSSTRAPATSCSTPSSRCSRSSARASRRRWTTRAPWCARCSSTPSATTSPRSAATSWTRAWALSLGSNVRTLTNPRFTARVSGSTDDLVELIRRLVALPIKIGLARGVEGLRRRLGVDPARRDRRTSSTSTSTSATAACGPWAS